MAASSSDERVMTRLKTFRRQLGWTQIQVAVRARVSRETIRKFERGEVGSCQLGTVVRVAHSFGASPCDLIPELCRRPEGRGRRRI